MSEKICTKCKQLLPITEFYKNTELKDGFYSSCKNCTNKRKNEWRASNKAKYIENAMKYTKTWREKNKKAASAICRNNNRKMRENLSDWYIRSKLHLSIDQATTELIEAKREQMLLHRAIKALKQEINHARND